MKEVENPYKVKKKSKVKVLNMKGSFEGLYDHFNVLSMKSIDYINFLVCRKQRKPKGLVIFLLNIFI